MVHCRNNGTDNELITHVVADESYGFIYTRDADEKPLTCESATELARKLNEALPPALATFRSYSLQPELAAAAR